MPMFGSIMFVKGRAHPRVLATALVGALLAFSLAGCGRSPQATAPETAGAAKLDYGTKVSFGLGGNSETFKVSGWSKTEEKFTWSEGAAAVLKMVTAPTDDTIILKVTMAALIKEPEFPFQPVEVNVNDQKITEWQVGNTAEFTATLPQDIAKRGGLITITFKTPKATSPKTLGLSADPRILGICCLHLELSKG